MADELGRETPWRQGLVLEHQAALDLGLAQAEAADPQIVVVVSHDCDIAGDASREPYVEVITGRQIAALGEDCNAKTARRLHITFASDQGPVHVELIASAKTTRPKEAIQKTQPRTGWQLTPENLVTLQKWLAARYHRAAFADEFERRLKAKPGKLDRKIAKALEEPGEHVLAVLFDVDEGEETQRNGEEDVYQLRITLLYDSSRDEPAAYKAAQKAANALESAFETAYCKDSTWKNIQLLSCDAVSDSAMTVAESRLLKQWRLDQLSLEADPQQPMLD